MLSLTKAFSLARSAAPHIAAVRPVPAALAPASSRIAFNQRQPGRRNLATLRAVREVSATEARELASSGAYQYLDVRTPEEFAAGHPPGAINIPFMFSAGGGMSPNPNFTKEVAARFPDKDEQLVIGCMSGMRSAKAVETLQACTAK